MITMEAIEKNKNSKEGENTSKQETPQEVKYADDITTFLAYQNWCWMNYTFSLYQNAMYHTAQNIQQMNNSFQLQTFQCPPFTASSISNNNNRGAVQQNQGRITVKLASIYRRISAELVDFLLLAFIKLFVIYYYYGESYLENFNFILIIDDNTKIEDLEWMIVHALIFRIIVVGYEGYMLSGTLPYSSGYTLGKKIMGIRVVHCVEMEDVNTFERTVSILPQPLGSARACLRSLLKNMSISFLFPMLLPVLMFNHNRLIYDIAVDSLVIENEIDHRNL